MKLMHYSDADEVIPESREPDGEHPKPWGLWVSDEDDYGWSAYCADHDNHIGANAFAVTLSPGAKLLTLATPAEMRKFHATFTREPYAPWAIDWPAVAKIWQGILITPFQPTMRLSECYWYYWWELASGCIWDAAAFKSLTPVPAAVDGARC